MTPKPRIKNKINKPRPADWGIGMTVCIACLCDSGDSVIAVSDQKVTLGNIAAEGVALKGTPIGWRWHVMFSGDDMTHAKPIIQRTQEILLANDDGSDDISAQDVADALAQAYDERLHRQIEAKYLKRFGLTVETFRDQGKEKLSSALYDTLINQIANEHLRCHFLAFGIADDNLAHIICFDEEGVPGIYDDVGFWAIGSGAQSALSSLAFHANQSGLCKHTDMNLAVYHACEAKFMAESNPLVGKDTFVVVVHGRKTTFLRDEAYPVIRECWAQHGAPRVPPGVEDQISKFLFSPEEEKSSSHTATQGK